MTPVKPLLPSEHARAPDGNPSCLWRPALWRFFKRLCATVCMSLILLYAAAARALLSREGDVLLLWLVVTLGLIAWTCAAFMAPVQITRASMNEKIVPLDMPPTEPAGVASWEPVQAVEEAVTDWDQLAEARDGPAWDTALRKARQAGWARFANGVMDFEARAILTPRLLSPPGQRTDIRGGQTGFLVAWLAEPHCMALAHFSLTGRLRSQRQLAIANRGEAAAFSPSGMEWDHNEVRIYGFRQGKDGNGIDVSVLKMAPPPL
jgi:hypothetical protein